MNGPTNLCAPGSWLPTSWADGKWPARFVAYGPYGLLAVGTALSMINPAQDSTQRWSTLGLVAAAAVWLLLTFTLPGGRWRTNPWAMTLHFAGLLTIASALMFQDVVYLVFLCVCFFHALLLRPLIVVVIALAASSLMINTIGTGGPIDALSQRPVLWLTIVLVQTAAITTGGFLSDKLRQQNERQRAAMAQLQEALDENAGLHRQLLAQARDAGVLDERQRLSREIHDTLAQGFTGIITQLEAAEQPEDEPDAWQRRVSSAITLARDNLAEARRSVHALGPGALASAGLPDALSGIANRWQHDSGAGTEFTSTGEAVPLHPEIEATLVRVTQEALANVGKHAHANRVVLTLSYMPDQVTLDIRDDGSGFEPAGVATQQENPGGFGLGGMRSRLQRLAGTLHVESEPGAGTAISAAVPAIPTGVSR